MFLSWYKQNISDHFLFVPVVYDMLLLCDVLSTFHRKRAFVFFFSVYFASVGLFPLNRIIYHNTTPPEHTETIAWEANKRSCSQFGCFSRNFLSYEFSINGLRRKMKLGGEKVFKDGAGLLFLLPYVLRIWRHSGFLWVVPY